MPRVLVITKLLRPFIDASPFRRVEVELSLVDNSTARAAASVHTPEGVTERGNAPGVPQEGGPPVRSRARNRVPRPREVGQLDAFERTLGPPDGSLLQQSVYGDADARNGQFTISESSSSTVRTVWITAASSTRGMTNSRS